jgi:hypothetical protein
MTSQELRNLQEAYLEVYEERSPSHPHWQTNSQFKKGEKKNQELISAAQKRREDRRRNRNPLFGPGGKMTKTQREQIDLYGIILSHLLDEGYAETPEAAEAIMVNMSEDWRESICEAEIEPPKERVGALTNIDIPQNEREAARQRTLAKAKEKREKKKN